MTEVRSPQSESEHRVKLVHATVLDSAQQLLVDHTVIVADGRIERVGPSASLVDEPAEETFEVGGRVLMPGLVDAHVHALGYTPNIPAGGEQSPFYVGARAAGILTAMLDRGFTTVRDCAGADFGLAQAVDEGHIVGPRVYFGGKGLSQTGGHGDPRRPGRSIIDDDYWLPTHCRVVDGADDMRRVVRDELRRGAHHIKLMLSGGVASPTDHVASTQFSVPEISAAVDEAEAAGRYVTGHAYGAAAINRGLDAGVRCIEHGNLLDETSIERFVRHDAFYVPTLITYQSLAEHGRELGLPEASYRKVFAVLDSGLSALQQASDAGVNLVFGTDLLGDMHPHQLEEFTLRSQVQKPADIVASATTTAARLLQADDRLGVVREGAHADLLVVADNPLEDIGVLTDPSRNLKLIMHAGRIRRNELGRSA